MPIPPAFFISNSIPKSGSTLMFDYQKQIFSDVYDSDMHASYERLSNVLGLDCTDGFVPPSKIPALEKFLMTKRGLQLVSPCVIKTHAPYSPQFAKFLYSSSSIFSSLCIRCPYQVLRSAMINHKLRPFEFKYFSNPIIGSLRITFFFYYRIYKSFVSGHSSRYPSNVIHYDFFKSNPSTALFNSMGQFFAILSNSDSLKYSVPQIFSIIDTVVTSSVLAEKVSYRISPHSENSSFSLSPFERSVTSFIMSPPDREFERFLEFTG